jgi:hypothetical protein
MRRALVFSWIAAVLWGALVPALIFAGVSRNILVLTLAFYVTLAHAAILGLPAAIYRAKQWTGIGTTIAGGFLIGALPIGVLRVLRSLHPGVEAVEYGVPTIVHGGPTGAYWPGTARQPQR